MHKTGNVVVAVSYTHLQCTLKGYAPCHNTEEVLAATGYDSERDTLHPTGSVFCAHGAGFLVPWYEVKEYMHLPSIMQEKPSDSSEEKQTAYRVSKETDAWIDTEEVAVSYTHLDVYKRQDFVLVSNILNLLKGLCSLHCHVKSLLDRLGRAFNDSTGLVECIGSLLC